MKIENPFHSGELEAQRRAGDSVIAERNSAVISDSIIAGALAFLKQQKMVVLGTESEDGALWASLLFGAPGFVSPLDARSVKFDRSQMRQTPADAFWGNLRVSARAGMLAIELATRRRLRVNGAFDNVGDKEFILAVKEAYPNCPKYIQRRTLSWDEHSQAENSTAGTAGTMFTPDAAHVLEAADTLFISSGHVDRGVDVSHRGGNPGFIQRLDAHSLRVPDFTGNSLFNTFGNLLVNPRAGVTVMDFAKGRMLQMTGLATPEWNQPDEQGVTGGTGRFWTFTVDHWRMLTLPGTARWEFLDASPFNPKTR
jgi:predicted pyridoxine 5'-phosphate oxidase superfamily flavin-nucleotide-binding protein